MIELRFITPLVPIVSPDQIEGEAGSTVYYPIPKDWSKPNYFTPKTVTGILEDIMLGLSLDDAAIRQSIKTTTAQSWYNNNYGNFKNAVAKARIDNKRLHLARIVAAENANKLKASAWFLERKHKEEFGKETNVNLTPRIPEEKQIYKVGNQEIEF